MAEEGLRVGVVVLEPFTANGLPDPAAGSDEYETAWPVYVGETPIGRTTSGTGANEICLLRKGLSKRHAVLDVEMDPPDDPDDPDAPPLVAAWIMDLGSTNGTRLQLGPRDPENAKPVKLKHHRMYQLLHNSIIQMGTTRLRFLLDHAEDPSEAPLPATIPPSPAPTGHHHHNHNLFASPAMLRRQGMMARGGPGLGLDQLPATVAPGGAEDEEEQPGDAGDDFECTPTMAPEEIDPRLSGAGLGGGAGGGGELAATLMAGDAGDEDFLDEDNVEDPQVPDTLRRPQQQQQQSHQQQQQQQQQQRGVLPRHISFSMVGTEATLMPAEAMDEFEDDEGDTGVGAAAAVTKQDLDETVVSPANSAATAAAVRNLLMETQDPEESAAGSLGSPVNGVANSTEHAQGQQGQQGQPQQQRSMSAAIDFDAMETVPAGDFYAGDEDQEEEEAQEGGHGKSEAAGATASQGSLRGSPSIPSLDPRSLDRASQVGFNHAGRQSRTALKDSDSADDDLAGMADGSRSDNNNDDDDGGESPVLFDPEDEEEVQADAPGVGEQLQSHAGPKTPPAQLQRQDAMIDDDDEIVAEAKAKAEGAQEQEQELDLTQDPPAPMPETPKLAGASASETNGMEVVAGTEEVDAGDHIMEDDDDIDPAGGDGEDLNVRDDDDTEELAALDDGLEQPQVQLAKQHQHAQSRFATVTTSPPLLDQPVLLQQPYPADQPPADANPDHAQEAAEEPLQRHSSSASSSRSSQPVRVKEEPAVAAGVVEPEAPVVSGSSSSNSVEHVSAPSAAVSSSSSEHATASSSSSSLSSSSSSSSHTAAWSSGPETPFSSPSSLSSPSPAAAKGLASSTPEEDETTEDDPVPVPAPAAAHSDQQSPPLQASPLASVPEASETAETAEISQGRRSSGRPRRSSKTPSSSSEEAASPSPASSSSTPETASLQAKTQPRSQSSRSQSRSASQASATSSSVSTDPAPATRASRRTRRGSTASTRDEAEDAAAMQDDDVANQGSDQDVAQKKMKQEPQDEQVEQEEAEPEKEKEALPLTRKASTRLTGRKRGQPEPESSSPPSSAASPSTTASTSSSTAASSSTTSRRRQKSTAAGSSSAAAVVAEEIVAGSSSADASGAGKTSRSSRGSARSKSGSSVASTPVAAAASSSNGERNTRKRRATTVVSSAAMDTADDDADANDGGDAQEQAEGDAAQGEAGGDGDHEEEENKEAQKEQADAAEEQDSSKPPARKRQRRTSNASASAPQPQSVVLMVTGIQPNAQTIKKAKVLGATFTEDPFLCTHVVTDKFKRTAKMMCAFALARPLVNQDWLEHSLSKGAWQDDSEYRLPNLAETQTKYNFAIGQSYARVREQGPLLAGWTVYSTKNVKPAREELEQIVRSCGGNYNSTMPRAHAAQRLIISCEADRALWPKLVKLGYRIHAWEALASGVLQQELDLDRNRLDVHDAEDEENGQEAVEEPKPKSKTGGRSRR